MVLPALAMVAAVVVLLTSLLLDRVRMQEVSATAARVIARGDAIPAQVQRQIDALGTMTVSLTSQYLTVELRRSRTVFRHRVVLTARSVARTEVSSNDFEQD
jgi:Flp pilus assembly protein TadG